MNSVFVIQIMCSETSRTSLWVCGSSQTLSLIQGGISWQSVVSILLSANYCHTTYAALIPEGVINGSTIPTTSKGLCKQNIPIIPTNLGEG